MKDFLKKQVGNQILNNSLGMLMGIPPWAVALGRKWSEIIGGYFENDPDYQSMAAENKRKGLLSPLSEVSRQVKTGDYW